jgi:hypothetical protein
MYVTDYSKFCNNETILKWKTESIGVTTITNINIPKLIELYGKPEIDPIHFRKIICDSYYKECQTNYKKDIEYEPQQFDFFIQPFIHWNILDENNQLEAIIHIEFFNEVNYRESKYPERNLEVDYFFNTELINNPNYQKYKNQLIEDFIKLKPLNYDYKECKYKDYPNVGIPDIDFTLEYLQSKYVQWNIRSKNKETYDKLSLLLEFKEFEYTYDSDKYRYSF